MRINKRVAFCQDHLVGALGADRVLTSRVLSRLPVKKVAENGDSGACLPSFPPHPNTGASLPTSGWATPQSDSLISVKFNTARYASMNAKEYTDYSFFDHQLNIGNIPERESSRLLSIPGPNAL